MKIMKYRAETEREAMLQAKEELGSEALILSIKSVKPKGIWSFFRKAYVEVTAALDDDRKEIVSPEQAKAERELAEFKSFISKLSDKQRQAEEKSSIAVPEPVRQVGIEPTVSAPSAVLTAVPQIEKKPDSEDKSSQSSIIRQVIYEQLLDNEVEENLANQLLAALLTSDQTFSLEEGLNTIYRQIVKELSEIHPVTLSSGKAKPIFFVGSTGVGKTTTIAKLASLFTLEKKCKVALITADTYRIAAVEQLRTYANILDIPIRVIYKEEEIVGCIEEFADRDLIFIDTAGRSYQDTKHLGELKELLNQVDDKQVYLVLSLSTKNSDLQKTVNAYDFTDFSLIFTKLDETLAYGSILNLRHKTGKPLAYITTGQNVPEDIAELDPYEIANKILGGVNS
ncbi:flagellar biosynthesis protein FlhF [Clostridiales bacterium COT073_COT-073]|nr:flagellar biosynthesis protein FlhF [Clostridiales bacterium COT073_COT-073]